jgi:DNA polymerase-1
MSRRSNCEQRSHAKTVNFESYTVFLLLIKQSNQLVFKESADLIEAYYQTYPRLKSYIQEQIDFARDNGFVQTIVRPSLFKDINSQNAIVRGGAERNAVNALFKKCC